MFQCVVESPFRLIISDWNIYEIYFEKASISWDYIELFAQIRNPSNSITLVNLSTHVWHWINNGFPYLLSWYWFLMMFRLVSDNLLFLFVVEILLVLWTMNQKVLCSLDAKYLEFSSMIKHKRYHLILIA